MALFDKRYTTFYWSASVNMPLSCTIFQFDVEQYRDLEVWVRGHSKSFKLVPFKSFDAVSYSPSIVTILHHFRDKARYWSKIVIFFHTPLHLTPPLGWFSSDYCHPVWHRKTRLAGLPGGKNNLGYV